MTHCCNTSPPCKRYASPLANTRGSPLSPTPSTNSPTAVQQARWCWQNPTSPSTLGLNCTPSPWTFTSATTARTTPHACKSCMNFYTRLFNHNLLKHKGYCEVRAGLLEPARSSDAQHQGLVLSCLSLRAVALNSPARLTVGSVHPCVCLFGQIQGRGDWRWWGGRGWGQARRLPRYKFPLGG